MLRLSGIPDWKDAAAYAALLRAERSAFAWEWLRRDTLFRGAAAHRRDTGGDPAGAMVWGLHAFENPELSAPLARPVWAVERYPFVLRARAEASSPGEDAFDASGFARSMTLVSGKGVEHLLLSDGFRTIRMDLSGASVLNGPVRLHFELQGIAGAERQLLVLRRLIGLVRTSEFATGLHRPDTRAGRHVLMLRAHDALQAGVTQREIAAVLLATGSIESRWRVRQPSLRSRVQRLTTAARRMADGAFWSLLD